VPLIAADLARALGTMPNRITQAESAVDWARAYADYARKSVILTTNPASATSAANSTLLPTLSRSGVRFTALLEQALIAFWQAAIPQANPAAVATIVLPGLDGLLRGPSAAAVMAVAKPQAMTPIARAIDSWTRSVQYSISGNPPTPVV
jgi:hypothetical protein